MRECAPNTHPTLEFPWGIDDNIGMNKAVYTVVSGEDNYGIDSFDLFDSEEKAMAHAKHLMDLYSSDAFKWEAEPIKGAVANWRAGCDYITIFLKEVK